MYAHSLIRGTTLYPMRVFASRHGFLEDEDGTAFGGYVKDGLVFQLDCAKNIVGTKWTDLIGGKVATLTSCTTDEGVVLTSGSSVTLPTIDGAEYFEVTTLNATTEEAQTTTSNTSPSHYSTAGTLYAIRAYSRTLNETEKAKNAAIDKERFVDIPNGALIDADGKLLIDSNGKYLIFNN